MEKGSHPGHTAVAAKTPPVASSAPTWRRAHLTVEERLARGRAARPDAPRSSHAAWEPAPDRPDPVALLEEQAADRVPELVPIRYGRMLVSPFTFYRGAALIMAADLAATPTIRHHGAALRRRPPVELRPVRHARAADDVRHQRLRRDAPRSVGVGRQAPRRELRGRRPRPRLRPADRRAIVHGRRPRLPRPDAPGRGGWARSTPGTTISRSGAARAGPRGARDG